MCVCVCAAELESSRKELERGQRELESNIDQVFTGSKHELQAKLEQHSSELQNKREELTAVSGCMAVDVLGRGLALCHVQW